MCLESHIYIAKQQLQCKIALQGREIGTLRLDCMWSQILSRMSDTTGSTLIFFLAVWDPASWTSLWNTFWSWFIKHQASWWRCSWEHLTMRNTGCTLIQKKPVRAIACAVLFLWLDSSAEILLCSMSYWVISEFLLVIAVSLTFYWSFNFCLQTCRSKYFSALLTSLTFHLCSASLSPVASPKQIGGQKD